MVSSSAVHNLLCRLGITANYMGFLYTACAVELCAMQPERLQLVTKWVYSEVASRYQTNLESGGAAHPSRKRHGVGEEPPAAGRTGWQAPAAKALCRATAGHPVPECACHPPRTRAGPLPSDCGNQILNRIHSANRRSKHLALEAMLRLFAE